MENRKYNLTSLQESYSFRVIEKNIFIYCVTLLSYFGISSLFFGWGILNHLSSKHIGMSSDSISFIWSFAWWLHALHHGMNPFFTDGVWFPFRYNMTQQNIIMFGNFLLASPIDFLFGPVVAYNITEIFASALSAWTAFILCRYITQSFWPAFIGGYFFGYSSYMLLHTLGHPILITLFPIPLLVLCCLKFWNQELSKIKFLVYYILLLAFLFVTSLETITVTVVYGLITLLLAFIIFNNRDKTWQLLKFVFLGGALTLIIVSPYLYLFFSTPIPKSGFPSAFLYSSDLLGFFVPSHFMFVTCKSCELITQRFVSGELQETYIGIPVIILMLVFAKEFWKQPFGKFIILFVIITSLASLGYALHINGHAIISFPWSFLNNIPLWKYVLPIRLGLFLSLAIAVMIAYWLTYSYSSLYIKVLLLCSSILFLLPTFNHSHFSELNPILSPKFISEKKYINWLKPNDVVVILPYAVYGPAMGWQMQSHFYFKMAGGYLGYTPEEFFIDPAANFLENLSLNINLASIKNLNDLNDLKSFLVEHQVSAILVANNFTAWKSVLSDIVKPIHVGDIDVYNLKPIKKQLQKEVQQNIKLLFNSWYFAELNSNGHWRWSPGNSSITVFSNKPVTIQLTTHLSVVAPRAIKIYLNHQLIKILKINDSVFLDHFEMSLHKGNNRIQFVSRTPPQYIGNDPRKLSFSLWGYTIQAIN